MKTDTGYRYESSFVHAFGPWHPNPSKSSLVCVTSHGVLRLLWPQNTNKVEFNTTTLDLESVNCSEDQISHASICSEKSKCCLQPVPRHSRVPSASYCIPRLVLSDLAQFRSLSDSHVSLTLPWLSSFVTHCSRHRLETTSCHPSSNQLGLAGI